MAKKNSHMKTGRMLTQLLLSIGDEKGEVSIETGRVITKHEKLARTMWSLALGKPTTDGDGNEVVRPPDKDMIKLIYERIEGRIGNAAETDEKMSVADRVTEQARKRIANVGGKPDDSGTGK